MNYSELQKIFVGKEELLDQLLLLEEKRYKIKEYQTYLENGKPIVITLLGSPRTGKTTISNNIYDFIKKSGLKLAFNEEPANALYKTFITDEEKKAAISNRYKFNVTLREFAFSQVRASKDKKCNVILCDRGYIDPYVWLKDAVNKNEITNDIFDKELLALRDFNKDFESIVIALYAEPEISIKRDYISSLSLDDRKYINFENLKKYNEAISSLEGLMQISNKKFFKFDTSNLTVMDTALKVTNFICDEMLKLGIQRKEAAEKPNIVREGYIYQTMGFNNRQCLEKE